jgi:hypothetical protein
MIGAIQRFALPGAILAVVVAGSVPVLFGQTTQPKPSATESRKSATRASDTAATETRKSAIRASDTAAKGRRRVNARTPEAVPKDAREKAPNWDCNEPPFPISCGPIS